MIKVRMYPNRQQETRLQQSLICCRELYNKALESMNENFRLTGTKKLLMLNTKMGNFLYFVLPIFF